MEDFSENVDNSDTDTAPECQTGADDLKEEFNFGTQPPEVVNQADTETDQGTEKKEECLPVQDKQIGHFCRNKATG